MLYWRTLYFLQHVKQHKKCLLAVDIDSQIKYESFWEKIYITKSEILAATPVNYNEPTLAKTHTVPKANAQTGLDDASTSTKKVKKDGKFFNF